MLILVLGAVQVSLMLSTGLAYGVSASRKGASLAVALLVPVLPWLLPKEALFFRGLFAVFSLLPIFKWIQMTADGDVPRPARRMWQWTAVFDVRRTAKVAPHLDRPLLAHWVLYSGVAAAGTGVVFGSAAAGPAGWALRLGGGVVAVVGLVQAIIDAVRLIHAGFGIFVPPIQRSPLAATSVREFWGRRWNRTVSDWLRTYAFNPLARRGHPGWGLVAAFALSALFHFYIVVVPLGLGPACVMAGFFMLQIPLIWLERTALGSAPPWARRVFAVVTVLATSPLFTLPFTRILMGG